MKVDQQLDFVQRRFDLTFKYSRTIVASPNQSEAIGQPAGCTMDYRDTYTIHLQVPGQWPRNLVDIKYEIPVHIDECIFPHGTPVCPFSANKRGSWTDSTDGS